jgi:hypothetical protein
MSSIPAIFPAFTSAGTFEAVLQHWAKARIEGPMQVIARFDDAAKQLIALGGLLQGLFFAVVALGGLKGHIPLWVVPLFFLPLIALVFCAAKVICTVPAQMEAIGTYTLMKRAADPKGIPDEDLTKAIQRWCLSIDGIAKKKHRWLFWANMLFLLSSTLTMFLLLPLLMM